MQPFTWNEDPVYPVSPVLHKKKNIRKFRWQIRKSLSEKAIVEQALSKDTPLT